MPQMAPMSWTVIFYFSLFILLTSLIKTYFSVKMKPQSKELSHDLHSSFVWKW